MALRFNRGDKVVFERVNKNGVRSMHVGEVVACRSYDGRREVVSVVSSNIVIMVFAREMLHVPPFDNVRFTPDMPLTREYLPLLPDLRVTARPGVEKRIGKRSPVAGGAGGRSKYVAPET